MFIECEFPKTISYRAQGGPVFNTTVNSGFSGFEQRNQNWQTARGLWTVSLTTPGSVSSSATPLQFIEMLTTFFLIVGGKANSFRLKDHKDFTNGSIAQGFGLADGTTGHFQLVKTYTAGGRSYQRVINKPVTSLVIDYLGNALLDTVNVSSGAGAYPKRAGYLMGGTGKYGLDETTGIISFGNPAKLSITRWDSDTDGNVRLFFTQTGGVTPTKNEQVFVSGIATTAINGTWSIKEVGTGWIKLPLQNGSSGAETGVGLIGWSSLILDNVVSVSGANVVYHYSSFIGQTPTVGQRLNVFDMQTNANGSFYITAVNTGTNQITATNGNGPATGAHAGIASTDWVPASGVGVLTATYQYDFPVRFDTDDLMIQLEESNVEGDQPIVTWNAITLREVRIATGKSDG